MMNELARYWSPDMYSPRSSSNVDVSASSVFVDRLVEVLNSDTRKHLMSFVKEREKKIYKQKALKFLTELRNVGELCRYHLFDIIDPDATFYRNNQFIIAVLVTVEEILNEDYNALGLFEEHVRKIVKPSSLFNRTILFDRCAFVKNASTSQFHEHGECRLLDPTRQILFNIIDKGYQECGAKNGFKIRKTYNSNTNDLTMFRNMKINFQTKFSRSKNAVLLLFSHYIPCTIPFHECAKLLKEFVQNNDHETILGYEELYSGTDKTEALRWLSEANITVISDREIKQEMEKQYQPLLNKSVDDDIDFDHNYCYYNTTEDIIDSFPKKRYLNRKSISKTVKKNICKFALCTFLENHR